MSSNAEIKKAIFRAALKQYYFQNRMVQETFPAFSKEEFNQLVEDGQIVVDKNANDRQLAAREHSFTDFYLRLTHSGTQETGCGLIFNGEGKPYRSGTATAFGPDLGKISEDFYQGKPIVFMGAGGSGMVRLQADADFLNSVFVEINRNYGGDAKKVSEVFETRSDPTGQTDWIAAHEKEPLSANVWSGADIPGYVEGVDPDSKEPGSGSFFNGSLWNAIHKLLFGTPSDTWAAYENHLKLTAAENCEKAAQADIDNGQNELDADHVARAESKGKISVKEKNAIHDYWQSVQKRVETAPVIKEETAETLSAPKEENPGLMQTASEELPKPEAEKKETLIEEDKKETPITEESKPHINEGKESAEPKKPEIKKPDDFRQTVRNTYIKAIEGEKKASGVNASMEDDSQFKLLEGRSPKRKFTAALDELIRYAKVAGKHGAVTEDDQSFVDRMNAGQLAKDLARTYLLGKMAGSFEDRGYYHEGEEFDYLSDFYKVTSRYDQVLERTTELFQNGKILQGIMQNPGKTLDQYVFNPQERFCDMVDSALTAGGRYELFSSYAMGTGREKTIGELREAEKGLPVKTAAAGHSSVSQQVPGAHPNEKAEPSEAKEKQRDSI